MEINSKLILGAYEQGRLVALPTETVYGLSAPINRPDLVERIFELKKRPKNDPLIVHVDSIEMAKTVFADWSEDLEVLLEKFWPGPLTIVSNKSDMITDTITSGEPTVAVRMPNHPKALQIISSAQSPLVAPSANPFTKLSPTKAEHVQKYFAEEDVLVIDGGECQRGIESTIILLDSKNKEWKLLRTGPVKPSEIKEVLSNYSQVVDSAEIPLTPGSHHTHYQPAVPLYLLEYGEEITFDGVTKELNLSSDFKQAESELYASLHALAKEADQIIFYKTDDFLNNPKWKAIRDRLSRAASKKN
jgi:L-threonylcarbamoyladenylate synthase